MELQLERGSGLAHVPVLAGGHALDFGCDLYFCAKALVEGTATRPGFVGRATKFAGSLKIRGELDEIREAIKKIVRENILLIKGSPSTEIIEYQDACLDLKN